MRREFAPDLDQLRAAAAAQIDRWHHAQLQQRMQLSELYAAKLRVAEREPHLVEVIEGAAPVASHRLMGEAAERGLSLDEMRALVRRRAAERDEEILRMDDQRRIAKRELAEATSAQHITNIHARHT